MAVERDKSWENSNQAALSGTPTATAAANMQVYLRALGTIRCRASSSSETDDAAIDVSGTTVAVVANI